MTTLKSTDYLPIEYGFLKWLMNKAKDTYCNQYTCGHSGNCPFCEKCNGRAKRCGDLSSADDIEIFHREYEISIKHK